MALAVYCWKHSCFSLQDVSFIISLTSPGSCSQTSPTYSPMPRLGGVCYYFTLWNINFLKLAPEGIVPWGKLSEKTFNFQTSPKNKIFILKQPSAVMVKLHMLPAYGVCHDLIRKSNVWLSWHLKNKENKRIRLLVENYRKWTMKENEPLIKW